jgi:hypothetical protein
MLRTGKTPQYGREASPGQDNGINREHGHFRPLHPDLSGFRRSEKWPTSLIKPN